VLRWRYSPSAIALRLGRSCPDGQPEGSAASHAPMKKTPKERRYELAERIEATAEAIRLLRSNTTGDAIAELQAIAEELKSVENVETPSALKEAADKALKVLLQIVDQLGTVRGSRMAISGTIALVVGGAGWLAVTALGLGLAFWEGKDAFLKSMEKLEHVPAGMNRGDSLGAVGERVCRH
jgi:DNA segregation ATPase FtsK/SpoIIIE-like protein